MADIAGEDFRVDELVHALLCMEKELQKLISLLLSDSTLTVNAFHLNHRDTRYLNPMIGVIKNVYHQTGADGRTTAKYPGAIATSEAAIKQAIKTNEAKDCFAKLVSAFRKQTGHNSDVAGALIKAIENIDPDQPRPFQNQPLRGISIKMATRKIPVCVDGTPHLISWTWDRNGRSITNRSASDAAQLIEKRGYTSEAALVQQQQLIAMGEEKIAIVQRHTKPTLYVTAAVPSRMPNGDVITRRIKRPASVPLLYPANLDTQTSFRFLNPEPNVEIRKPRKDKRIPDAPDFSTIRGHISIP